MVAEDVDVDDVESEDVEVDDVDENCRCRRCSRGVSAEDVDAGNAGAGDVDADGGGEAGVLGLGLNSCEEEELQASVTGSYLRRGLVEQRELVPAPWSREGPGRPGDLGLAGTAYLDGGGVGPGDQQVAWHKDSAGRLKGPNLEVEQEREWLVATRARNRLEMPWHRNWMSLVSAWPRGRATLRIGRRRRLPADSDKA